MSTEYIFWKSAPDVEKLLVVFSVPHALKVAINTPMNNDLMNIFTSQPAVA
jgi:hypothetical protein